MGGDVDIAFVAALLADPARAQMLTELLGGEALAAGELARRADLSPSGASNHLRRLRTAGIVVARPHGRIQLYTLASIDIAQVLEGLARIAPQKPVTRLRDATAREALARARTCYDHLAGMVGVRLTQCLLARQILSTTGDGYAATRRGTQWFADELEIDIEELRQSRRAFAIRCIDVTEREPHLAGALGAAVAKVFLTRNLVRRLAVSRALQVTDDGLNWLAAAGVDVHGTRIDASV